MVPGDRAKPAEPVRKCDVIDQLQYAHLLVPPDAPFPIEKHEDHGGGSAKNNEINAWVMAPPWPPGSITPSILRGESELINQNHVDQSKPQAKEAPRSITSPPPILRGEEELNNQNQVELDRPPPRPVTPSTLPDGTELTNQNQVKGINDLIAKMMAALDKAEKEKERRSSADIATMAAAQQLEGGLLPKRFLD